MFSLVSSICAWSIKIVQTVCNLGVLQNLNRSYGKVRPINHTNHVKFLFRFIQVQEVWLFHYSNDEFIFW